MTDTYPEAAPRLDATAWLRRWDQQQAHHVPGREQTFTLMLDVLERLGALPGRVLDLACGPGSLAQRALARFPDAEVFGLDLDPVMLELGRRTLANRVQWVEADLRTPDWGARLPDLRFDAVISATGLHWLDTEHLPRLTETVAGLLRGGGAFLNFDTLHADPALPRLAALITELRQADQHYITDAEEIEDFYTWWSNLAAEPELRELFHERDRRWGVRRHGAGTTLSEWDQHLAAAGFTEITTLTQYLDRRLLMALR